MGVWKGVAVEVFLEVGDFHEVDGFFFTTFMLPFDPPLLATKLEDGFLITLGEEWEDAGFFFNPALLATKLEDDAGFFFNPALLAIKLEDGFLITLGEEWEDAGFVFGEEAGSFFIAFGDSPSTKVSWLDMMPGV